MDNIGIIKEIDGLGRIVIPKELRERLLLEKRVELILTKRGLLIRNPEYCLVKKGAPAEIVILKHSSEA